MKRIHRTEAGTGFNIWTGAAKDDVETLRYAVQAYRFLLRPGEHLSIDEFIGRIQDHCQMSDRHEAIFAAMRRTVPPRKREDETS